MKLINQMSAREAMKLPEYYESGLLENMTEVIQELNLSTAELVAIVESDAEVLLKRIAAATLLSLFGDPRIIPEAPVMLAVPGATVALGSTSEEIEQRYHQYASIGVLREWLQKEYPLHKINIPAFRISKYLVTNYEYLLFLKATQHTDIPTSWRFGIYDVSKANHPVYGILPESADHYAAWLANKTQRRFRLPTEYEWEYAAAGLDRLEFPWGDFFTADKANTLESKIFTTTPVGVYPNGASPFGCLDMAGNVEEYVANNYFAYPDGIAITDDLGSENQYRVARGGSFTRHADLARCRRRHGNFSKEIYVIGFRLVEEI